MRPRLAVSRSAVELIKTFEGFRPKAAQLDDGRWTIGYGHTLTAREGAEISERDAEALLLYDLIQPAHAVNEHVFAPLNQNEFDALVSFAFNIGVRAFRGSPTLRRLNEGRPLEAALAMELWRKADLDGERIVIDALVRRRAAEKALFLKPPQGWTPAPSALLAPKLDYDAVGLVPLDTPVATRHDLLGERAQIDRAALPAPDSESSSVTDAAAAAISRLEALLAEPFAERRPEAFDFAALASPAPPPEPPAEPPAPAEPASPLNAAPSPSPLSEPPAGKVIDEGDAPAVFASSRAAANAPVFTVERSNRRRGPSAPVLALTGFLGLAFIVMAAVWSLQPARFAFDGMSSGLAVLVVGGIGLVLATLAGYFLLERLGRARGGLR